MKIVAITRAVQMPRTSSGGNTGAATSGSVRHGSGKCHSARTVIAKIANTASAMTGRRDRIVAATVTGARIRIANGFCNPPVRNSSTASCSRS